LTSQPKFDIIYIEKEMRDTLKPITPPAHCPTCSTELQWTKDQMFCHNTTCEGKTSKKVEHFAKTLKIKGLGPATIEKLQITGIFDIYDFNLDLMIEALQSEKLAVKLLRQIEASKTADLVELLPAFSIKLIGNTAAKKLCQTISSMRDLSEDACKQAGLGPIATDTLLEWYYEQFINGYDKLPFSWKTKVQKPSEVVSKGVVCISGKLTSYKTKAAATKELEITGYIVKSSLTKDVTILVNESGVESAKTQAARERGVQIITNLKEITGN